MSMVSLRSLNPLLLGTLSLGLAVACGETESDGGGGGGGAPVTDAGDLPDAGGGAGGGGAGGGGAGGGVVPDEGVAPVATGLELTANSTSPIVGDRLAFTATLVFSDGSRTPVADAALTVDDARVLSLEGASAEAIAGGPVTVRVEHEGFTAEWSNTVKCGEYPFYVDFLQTGSTAPPLNWTSAFKPDGTPFHFSLDDFRCFADYADSQVLVLVLGAGWCPACTQWTYLLDRWLLSPSMAGVEILHVVGQTADFGPASSDYANAHITRLIGDGHGIRVGDQETRIEDTAAANFVVNNDITFFPTTFVIRKSDMRVITDSTRARSILPLADISADPTADWSRNVPGPQFIDACGANDEEATDADNDFFVSATVIGPGTHTGGICNAQLDYYRIDVEGPWRATLRFSHATGDLGIYAYERRPNNEPGFQPIQTRNGSLVGSDGVTDEETFEYTGATTIGISGFLGAASGPYTLEIEAL